MMKDIIGRLKEYSRRQYICVAMIFFMISFIFSLAHIPQFLMRIYWVCGLTVGIFVCIIKMDIEPISSHMIFGAYVLRLIVIISNYRLNNIISSFLHIGDDNVFANASIQFYRKTPGFEYPSKQLPKLMAALYHVSGEDVLIGLFILMTLYIIGCIAFYHIMGLLKASDRIKRVGIGVLCYAPYGIIYSVLFMREQINFCFLTLSFLLFVKHVYSRRILELFAAMLLSLPAIWMHWGYIPVLAGYIVYFFLFYQVTQPKRAVLRLVKLALLTIFIIGTYILISHSGRIKYFIEAGNFMDGLQITLKRYIGLGGDSTYLKEMTVEYLWQLFVYTPLRVIYFFFSPLPMDWRDWRDALSFALDSSLYLSGVIAYVCLIFRKKASVPAHTAFLIVAFTGAVFCWGTVTAGAAIRHRNCLLGFFLFIMIMALTEFEKHIE